MNLRVERAIFTQRSTIGKLFVNGDFEAYTLEPVWRTDGVKPRAIPEGTFDLKYLWSKKHNREMPHVMNVPDFTEVEIHPLNTWTETQACLGVGKTFGPEPDWIGDSVDAFYNLLEKLVPAWERKENVTITYVNTKENT